MIYDLDVEVTLKVKVSLNRLKVEDKPSDSFTGLLEDSARAYLKDNLTLGTVFWDDRTLEFPEKPLSNVPSIDLEVINWNRQD